MERQMGNELAGRLLQFASAFGMPESMLPWIDVVASPQEVDMVLALQGGPRTLEPMANHLGLPQDAARERLYRAHCREIVNRRVQDGVEIYEAGSFYRRMDVMATFEFETYRRVPAEIRRLNHAWHLKAYEVFWQPAIDQIRRDPDHLPTLMDVRLSNRDILLLEDALEMIDAASLHVLYPCGCQGLVVPGTEPIEASVRLDAQAEMVLDRGQGRRVTRGEMKQAVVAATRAGRVITGLHAWRQHEAWGLGLCDPTISYSFCVGAAIGLAKKWPRSHYLAQVDWTHCKHCGDCIASCPFAAFGPGPESADPDLAGPRKVQYDPAQCWGCGLCRAACDEGVIGMVPLQA